MRSLPHRTVVIVGLSGENRAFSAEVAPNKVGPMGHRLGVRHLLNRSTIRRRRRARRGHEQNRSTPFANRLSN
jgi:hypothetical protein